MNQNEPRSRLSGPALDLAALAALCAFAWWALGFLIRDDLFIFADNPGTYFRLWSFLDYALPAGKSLLSWIPFWWAGWPEWQFYPPSYALTGLLLKIVSFGTLNSVQIYEWLVFLCYLVPALVAYAVCVRFGFGRLTGFAAGFFLLVFTDIYGGTGGVMIGMLGDRPALGLAPLAWLLGVAMAETRRRWLIVPLLGVTLSAIFLLHPFRLLLPSLLIVLTYAFWLGPVKAIRPAIWFALSLGLAFLLSAFWLLPYVAVSSLATPVLRAGLDTLPFWLMGGRLPFFLLFAAWGMLRLVRAGRRERALIGALALSPILVLAFMLFDWLVLVDRLKSYSLDPIRFIEDVYLPILLLAGAGLADLVRLALERAAGFSNRYLAWSVGAFVAATLGFLVFQPFPKWVEYYRPQPAGEPRFLSDAVRDYRLERLWDVLRQNPGGRVLFTSSVFRLRQTGDNVPSYLMALTPKFTGRETIGGTFQHWAPVATFYWYGDSRIPVMQDRTDLKDDDTIFGLKWRQMDEAALVEDLKKLNVTDVVATDYDIWTRTFLDRSPAFKAVHNDPQYVVYRLVGYEPSPVSADPSSVKLSTDFDGETISLNVESAAPGAEVLLKQTYYPRWSAQSTVGQIELSQDRTGLTRVRLPEGRQYLVTLRYQPGVPERAGELISLLGLGLTVVPLLAGAALSLRSLPGLQRRSTPAFDSPSRN